MSMAGHLVRLSGSEVERLKAISFADESADETIEAAVSGAAKRDRLSLGDSWHVIHYLLTGSELASSKPLAFIMGGGESLHGTPYGPEAPRAFTPSQVRKIATALQRTTKKQLLERYDPAQLDKRSVYPPIWDRPEDATSVFDTAVEVFDDLVRFVGATADNKHGLVVYILM